MSPSGFTKLFLVFLLSFRVKATGLALVTLELGDPIRMALSGETVDLTCKIHIPPNSTDGKAGVYRVAEGGESLIGTETEYPTNAEPKTETKPVHFIAHDASFTGSYRCRYTSNEKRVQSTCYLLVRDVGYREPSSFIWDIVTLSILSAIFLVFSVTGTGVLLWKRRVCACPGTEERDTETERDTERDSERDSETERDTERDSERDTERDKERVNAEKQTVKEPSIYTALEPRNPSLYTTLEPTPKNDKNVKKRKGGEEKKKKKKKGKALTNQPQTAAADEGIFESVYENL